MFSQTEFCYIKTVFFPFKIPFLLCYFSYDTFETQKVSEAFHTEYGNESSLH